MTDDRQTDHASEKCVAIGVIAYARATSHNNTAVIVVVCGLKASPLAADCLLSSPLIDTERSLAILLGLHGHYQLRSTGLSLDECCYSHWLHSAFFSGGLQVLHAQNPYEEEKDESRTPTSSATTPGQRRSDITRSHGSVRVL